MKKLKRYKEFNEELNLKTAALAGSLALSSLTGCDVDTNTQNINNQQTTQQVTDLPKSLDSEWVGLDDYGVDESEHELPNSFKMTENILSIGTDMSIESNGEEIGKVEERTLNFGKTFEYFDSKGDKKAIGKQKVFSLATTIEIFDENNKKIGTFKEELFKGMFSFSTYYTISDAFGNLIGESEKIDWLSTNIEIKSTSGEILCQIHRPAFNLVSDHWEVNISGDIDKRLVVFLPCYKTSADNERRNDE